MLQEIVPFINEQYVQNSKLAIQCCEQVLLIQGNLPENIKGELMNKSVALSGSPSVQGQDILDHLRNLFVTANKQGLVKGTTIDTLIHQTSISARASAKMAASILVSLNPNDFNNYLGQIYQNMLNFQPGGEEITVKAVLCLGEIGCFRDLSGLDNIILNIEKLMQSSNEDVRQATAICLGGLSIGNTQYFL